MTGEQAAQMSRKRKNKNNPTAQGRKTETRKNPARKNPAQKNPAQKNPAQKNPARKNPETIQPGTEREPSARHWDHILGEKDPGDIQGTAQALCQEEFGYRFEGGIRQAFWTNLTDTQTGRVVPTILSFHTKPIGELCSKCSMEAILKGWLDDEDHPPDEMAGEEDQADLETEVQTVPETPRQTPPKNSGPAPETTPAPPALAASDETPVEVPNETPVEVPNETPVEVPNETPVEVLDEVMKPAPIQIAKTRQRLPRAMTMSNGPPPDMEATINLLMAGIPVTLPGDPDVPGQFTMIPQSELPNTLVEFRGEDKAEMLERLRHSEKVLNAWECPHGVVASILVYPEPMNREERKIAHKEVGEEYIKLLTSRRNPDGELQKALKAKFYRRVTECTKIEETLVGRGMNIGLNRSTR